MQTYSLHKSHRTLRSAYHTFKKKGHCLSETERVAFEGKLRELDSAILAKDRLKADVLAREVKRLLKRHFPKSPLDHAIEIAFALVFAIAIAFVVRQVWFELYQVPTGSMRPTIEELDRLVVSKTTFGINVPFTNRSFLYNPKYLKRAGIIVFTTQGMDIPGSDTYYFYLFPGKKRYVKRCCGKPGDTLYFYGGQIYGVDQSGNPITEFTDETFLKEVRIEKIDHIPYINMEGKVALANPIAHGVFSEVTMSQMGMPVADLHLEKEGKIGGTFFNGKEWIQDNPAALKEPHESPQSYSDLWGIGNFAMARLLTRDEVIKFYGKYPEKAPLYLELRHTPNLTYPRPEVRMGDTGKAAPTITPFVSIIPMSEEHLDALADALITSRFRIQGGHAFRYQDGRQRPQHMQFDPRFPGVPDGIYEFYYGKGYRVHMGGYMTALPKDSPLYSRTPEMVQKMFNLGIGFNLIFHPFAPNQAFHPQRFAYYRDGDLYVMGAPILRKGDRVLEEFVAEEKQRQQRSSSAEPYIAFIDRGPPLRDDGSVDVDFIRAFGLRLPEDGVLALGDNFSMSADSRDFGFAPLRNLRGAPSFIFWPFGKRFGPLPQPSNPWLTLPNLIVWGAVLLIILICYFVMRDRLNKPTVRDERKDD